jgi:plasmid maintenance system antidote protein VapI
MRLHRSKQNSSKMRWAVSRISQSNLAKYMKSRGRVSELLTGKRCPSKAETAILRELLGISADILISRVDLEEACPKN